MSNSERTSEHSAEYNHGYQNGLNQGNLQYHILKQDLLKNMIPRAKVRELIVAGILESWYGPPQSDNHSHMAEAIADRLLAETEKP